VIVGGLLGAGVATLAYWRKALTRDGAVAAALVGWLTFARGGRSGTAALLTFFVSSTLLSRVGEHRKRALPLAQTKGARRDAWQVLANGGAATLCFGVGQRRAAIGALAAAGADTWATELGMLSRRTPRLITTLRSVEAGTSGGVTPEGLLASAGGALCVALAAAAVQKDASLVRSSVLAGVGGAVFDSFLGATLQAVYRCPQCHVLTEADVHPICGTPTVQERGLRWMTNDAVNLLATVLGAAIGGLKTPDAAGHVRGGS
jgi:uncharacterized protein (TIGR00297 family)